MLRLVIILSLFYINAFANQSCIKCHEKESKKCESSNHYTLKNAINITREIWGIKDSNVTLQTLPYSPLKIEKPADLVDDFLRRKCLKCHLDITNSGEKGMKRGKSCLACHTKHSNKDKCQVERISNDKCLACHNKQFVGTDYLGMFAKDHHHSFRAPLTKDGLYPSQKYGIDHHSLNEDIHHTLKMTCVDCHNNNNNKSWQTDVKCINCHQTPSKQNHSTYHQNISCSACHSSWNMSSYEFSVFRDDTADYAKWKDLTLQEDRYLTNFLKKALKSKKAISPKMPDWIDKELKEGIWYSGFRYKRWENFILANSDDGTIKILRPLFQYRISYRDKNGTMILDDVNKINEKNIEAWIPYSPHTISKKAKSCEMCHNNKLQFDIIPTSNHILNLTKPQNIINGSFLSKEQLNKLKSKKYKKIRAKILNSYY